MNYLKNYWYVAAAADEVTDRPFARRICDLDIVIYRGRDGQAIALQDFCPHRGLPLSLGRIEGNSIRCGYHGMLVDCQGQCESMPGQTNINRLNGIDSYATAECYGYIWLWLGEQRLADPAKLPQMPWGEGGNWAFGGGMYHMQCDYQLLIDNLMDLTHETYVHASSIGQPEIEEAKPVTTLEGNEVVLTRWMHSITPPPFWERLYGSNEKVDRWQICRFFPPSNVHIDVGVARAGSGAPQGDRSQGISALVCDFITPETPTSCWYFWGFARDFRTGEAALTDEIRQGQGAIFSEDMAVLEAQQRRLLAYPDRRLVTLDIDSGGAVSRRVIQRLLDSQ